MNDHIVEVTNLTVKYGQTTALEDVSFSMEKGDYVGLAGPNGAGKSSLVKAMLGLVPLTQGTIKLFGQDVAGPFHNRWRIGYLPQKNTSVNPLFPSTVKEAVGTGLLAEKKFPKRLDSKDGVIIDSTLQSLGLTNLSDRLVSELSGGQQQRVFLARALVSGPELLILDEPITALDPAIREDFFELMEKLNSEKKVTMIMITHDTGHIGQYARKLLYLDKELVFFGFLADFCRSEDMSKYFGDFAQHIICHQH